MRTARRSGAGDRDRVADALGDVIRVDQQRGLLAQRRDLRGERGLLVSCSSVKACAAVPVVGMP